MKNGIGALLLSGALAAGSSTANAENTTQEDILNILSSVSAVSSGETPAQMMARLFPNTDTNISDKYNDLNGQLDILKDLDWEKILTENMPRIQAEWEKIQEKYGEEIGMITPERVLKKYNEILGLIDSWKQKENYMGLLNKILQSGESERETTFISKEVSKNEWGKSIHRERKYSGCRTITHNYRDTEFGGVLEICASINAETNRIEAFVFKSGGVELSVGGGVIRYYDAQVGASLLVTTPLGNFYKDKDIYFKEEGIEPVISFTFNIEGDVGGWAVEGAAGPFTHTGGIEGWVNLWKGDDCSVSLGVGWERFGVHAKGNTPASIDTVIGGTQNYVSGIVTCEYSKFTVSATPKNIFLSFEYKR